MYTKPSGWTWTADYHYRRASRWAGFKRYAEFCALDGLEQSEIVAEYEAHMTIMAIDARMAEKDNG